MYFCGYGRKEVISSFLKKLVDSKFFTDFMTLKMYPLKTQTLKFKIEFLKTVSLLYFYYVRLFIKAMNRLNSRKTGFISWTRPLNEYFKVKSIP